MASHPMDVNVSPSSTPSEADEIDDTLIIEAFRDLSIHNRKGSSSSLPDAAKAAARRLEGFSAEAVLERLIPMVLNLEQQQQQQQQQQSMDVCSRKEEEEDSPEGDDGPLNVLVALVTQDPRRYLRPASRLLRRTASALAETSKTTMDTETGSHTPFHAQAHARLHVPFQLVEVVSSQVVGSDVEVACDASETARALCRSTVSSHLLRPFLEAVIRHWDGVTEDGDSTVAVRCAETAVRLGLVDVNVNVNVHEPNGGAARHWTESGASRRFQRMLMDGSDPLVQMACMDLLEEAAAATPSTSLWLTNTNHNDGYDWLVSVDATHLWSFLVRVAGGGDDEDADPFLGGPALRVLSLLVRRPGCDDDRRTAFFRRVLSRYDYAAGGEATRMAFVDAVSSLAASSDDAMGMVLGSSSSSSDVNEVVEGWLLLRNAPQPKLKAVILLSVARTLEASTNATTLSSRVVLYERFGQVNNYSGGGGVGGNGTTTTAVLLGLARSPMPEIRIASYTVLTALVKSTALIGARILLDEAGALEFLCSSGDTLTEPTKEGKERKHGIVLAVLAVESIETLLETDVYRRLDRVRRQGPYYVPTRTFDLMEQ